MNNQTDNRTPEEIERDIERTRADFSSTVEAIQSKLNPSDLADQAVDYVMTTPPVAYSVDLYHSVRSNPIPVAMMGLGLAWFMSANRQSKEQARYSRQQRVVRRGAYPAGTGYGYENAHLETRHSRNSEEGVIGRASSMVSETGRDLKDKASETGQRLSNTASEMTDRAREMRDNAASRLHETTEQAQARASELRQRSQEQYYRAKDQFSQMLDEQPLVVGALGIAIGAALGATLPATRRENDLLGPTRDDLFHLAKDTAREQAETVKQSAQRVAEVAKEEVARVAELVKAEGGNVADAAKNAVSHVTDVAKEEAGHVSEAAKKDAKQVRDKM